MSTGRFIEFIEAEKVELRSHELPLDLGLSPRSISLIYTPEAIR